jgi:SAM-dependent methyltransferase
MSDSQLRTIETFHRLLGQPAQTAVLNAALRLGIIDALREGQKTAGQLERKCELRRGTVTPLMELLKPTGLVEQFGEHYALSQAAQMAPRSLWAAWFEQWTHLEASLRPDNAALSEYDRLRAEEHRRERFLASRGQMQWAATGAALKAAEALDIGGHRRSLHILDLGCGAAVYSMTLAHRDPGCIVRLVDNANGLARARATVQSLDIESRVSMLETDDLNIPGSDGAFDLVILGDHIHQWSADEQEQLLRTGHRVLGPGGEIAIVDVFAGQERGQLAVSQFALQLLIGTGNAVTPPELLNERLLRVGFTRIQFTHLPAPPWTHGLVVGIRE